MTVRWQAGDFNGVPSGYNGSDVPIDVRVPPCGIEDVDEGLFNLFNSEIGFQVKQVTDGQKVVQKVPVFFGVGEKWANVKRNKRLRDRQGTLILPLISIRRISIDQKPEQDQAGRGINQATGELVFRRRLGQTDREYQNLVNRQLIANQDNLPTGSNGTPVGSKRQLGLDHADPVVQAGGLLSPLLDRNVWEILTIPAPQFFTANYEITFWAQYTTHMNQMVERLLAALLPQLPALKLTTKPGYWFVGYVNGDYRAEDNTDDLLENERVLKYSFTIKVPAYTVAPAGSGLQSPVRRFLSAPDVSFDISGAASVPRGTEQQGPASNADGADDPTLGYSLEGEVSPRPVTDQGTFVSKVVRNPFTQKESMQFSRVITVNTRKGESVFIPVNPGIEFELE